MGCIKPLAVNYKPIHRPQTIDIHIRTILVRLNTVNAEHGQAGAHLVE